MTPLDAARIYVGLGWLVFPIVAGTKRPLTKNGHLAASCDLDLIAEWFTPRDGRPAPNVGIATGPDSGIFVLDCDVEDGRTVGEETLADLCGEHGELPSHPIAETPSGGRHHVFAWPADGIDLPNRVRFANGLDARGGRFEGAIFKGGYIVAFPSMVDDVGYRWQVGPTKVAPPQAPPWLLEKIRAGIRERPADLPRLAPVRGGSTTPYGAKVLAERCREVAACPPGSQETTLNAAAVRIGSLAAGGEIDEGEGFNALVDAAMCMVNAGTPWQLAEVRRKVRSGMTAGALDPYRPRERQSPPRGAKARANAPAPLPGVVPVASSGGDGPPDDGPLPLFPPLPPAEPFPVEALGPVLAPAAAAIARKVQVPESIAGQSVLAVAALAAQAHADVRLPYGQTRPLSLNFVSIADSGDRKSAADTEALWPIRKREKTLNEARERHYHEATIAHAAWVAQKRKIENSGKTSVEGKRDALTALGPQPEFPLSAFLTISDLTIEGLAKAWLTALPALGVFTAEGGQFIGSHGMKDENRLRNAAGYNELWDGQPIKRIRAGDGVTMLYGRRLSMHLMVQPEAASRFLADPTLRNLGFLSRFLVASPESLAGTRLYRATAPEDDAAIRTYGARVLTVLEAPLPLAAGKRNELEPRVLVLSAEAEAIWCAFSDHVEKQCAAGEELRPLKDFAAKAAEHAARMAGILTIVEDHRAIEIAQAAMRNATMLADWYVKEALRLHHAGRLDPGLKRAQDLLDWLRKQDAPEVKLRDMLNRGPAALRRKTVAEEALRILADHRWVTVEGKSSRRVRLVGGEGEA